MPQRCLSVPVFNPKPKEAHMKKNKNKRLNLVRVQHEMRALVIRNRKPVEVLKEGLHWRADLTGNTKIVMLDRRDMRLPLADPRQVAASGLLESETMKVELSDAQRAIVRTDGRITGILEPGLHLLWTGPHRLDVETVDADTLLKDGEVLRSLIGLPECDAWLRVWELPDGSRGVFYRNGRLISVENPGLYAAWQGRGSVRMIPVDCRESPLEIAGQDMLTADRVTLRVNVGLLTRVKDVATMVSASVDARDALYREAQLAVRAEIGGRTLDELLVEKQQLGEILVERLQHRAKALGLEICQAGLRDIILPGEMKDILNQVILAGKQAEANGILRREETAAMRSQMNTAKLIRDNPTLMRLRELEVIEKISENGKLNIVLGEKGLADRITNLI
jgi:regulator of protease activity HflC (stomatin/prohibitin superfamily)